MRFCCFASLMLLHLMLLAALLHTSKNMGLREAGRNSKRTHHHGVPHAALGVFRVLALGLVSMALAGVVNAICRTSGTKASIIFATSGAKLTARLNCRWCVPLPVACLPIIFSVLTYSSRSFYSIRRFVLTSVVCSYRMLAWSSTQT